MNKIREKLYISNKKEAENIGKEFDQVITLCKEKNKNTTHHFPINDGKNGQKKFDRIIDEIKSIEKEKGKTLVHCAAGMSRSPTVVSILISEKENIRFEKAHREVRNKHPESKLSVFLIEQAKDYLGEKNFQEYG